MPASGTFPQAAARNNGGGPAAPPASRVPLPPPSNPTPANPAAAALAAAAAAAQAQHPRDGGRADENSDLRLKLRVDQAALELSRGERVSRQIVARSVQCCIKINSFIPGSDWILGEYVCHPIFLQHLEFMLRPKLRQSAPIFILQLS